MTKLLCQCPGNKIHDARPCPSRVTQEDGLYDNCRFLRCPEITTVAEWNRRCDAWDRHVAEMLRSM